MSDCDGAIDVGQVHVLTEPGGECVENCPHRCHHLATLREQARELDAEITRLAEQVANPERTPTGKRPRKVIPECGTETAYQRHRYRGEDIDEACRAGHNAYNRAKERERRAR